MKQSAQLLAWGVAAAFALAGLTGCGDSTRTTAPSLAPQIRTAAAVLPDGLSATVTEDKAAVPVGGTVTYTMALVNTTAKPIRFRTEWGGKPASGVGDTLTIKDGAGSVAFPQGVFKVPIYISPLTTLAPGQSLSGTLAVGADKHRGQFSASGRYTTTVDFSIRSASGNPASATVGPLTVDAE